MLPYVGDNFPSGLSTSRGCAKGFTLVELVIVMALLVILATVAVPSMRSFLLEQNSKAATTDFVRGFNLARAEAIRRNQRVTLAASDCINFQSGWKVFIDDPSSNNQCHDGTETLIMQGNPLNSALQVTWVNGDGNKPYIIFNPSGSVALANNAVAASRWSITSPSASSVQVRTTCINFYGRTRTVKGTTVCS